jgi:flagellar M-ring protein FliF
MAAAGTETTETAGAGKPLDRAREALARLSNKQKVVLMVSIARSSPCSSSASHPAQAKRVQSAVLEHRRARRRRNHRCARTDEHSLRVQRLRQRHPGSREPRARCPPAPRLAGTAARRRRRLRTDGSQKFGISQFAEQVNYQRGLEGELSRTIQSIAAVQAARVHLAIPKPSVFMREEQKPSASVLLNLYPGRALDATQIAGIQNLVAASVPQLAPPASPCSTRAAPAVADEEQLLEAGLDPTQASTFRKSRRASSSASKTS